MTRTSTRGSVGVAGLYLDRPQGAAVFSLRAHKPGCGEPEGRVARSAVPGRRRLGLSGVFDQASDRPTSASPRITGSELVAFLRSVDTAVGAGLDLHVITTSLPAYRSAPVRRWLEHKRRRRWHLHLTPDPASWSSTVEDWLAILRDTADTPDGVGPLMEFESHLGEWLGRWTAQSEPHIWALAP
ncbi:MAG: hypothetical protein U5R31_16520 [Acidimicrobiia bacterium]|nr:hypothetical protein [Acidimicrobiia bacterium]